MNPETDRTSPCDEGRCKECDGVYRLNGKAIIRCPVCETWIRAGTHEQREHINLRHLGPAYRLGHATGAGLPPFEPDTDCDMIESSETVIRRTFTGGDYE